MSRQTPPTTFRTGIGASEADSIMLLGHDLATELLGKISFGELAYWLLTNRRPSDGTAGDVRSRAAWRSPTTASRRPRSPRGSRCLDRAGVGPGRARRRTARRWVTVPRSDGGRGVFLDSVISSLDALPVDDTGWDAVALEAVAAQRADGRFVPGLGHPVHKQGDPRTPVLLALAREHGEYGPHLALFEAIGRVHAGVLGRSLPLNGAGVCGAVLADIEIPLGIIRGVALLARCAGLLGHIAEEQRDPIVMDIYTTVDRNTDYRPS